MSKSALILGASRGLGLGLAAELAGRGWHVVATQRSPSAALAAAAEAGNITVDTVDIDDAAAVAALAARQPGPFDLVFVNAGVSGPKHGSADQVTRDELAGLMQTNAISPIRAARALLSHVTPGGTIAFMSSILGSVALRTKASAELYCASKAALNMLTRGFAGTDAAPLGLAVLTLHPGWVKTDMGGEAADITVDVSVAGLADVLERETAPGHRYLDYTGKTLPW